MGENRNRGSGNGNGSGGNRPRQQQKKNKGNKVFTLVLASVLVCVVSGGGTYLYSQMNGVSEVIGQGGIYPNIYIDGVSVEGLSVDEAVAYLQNEHNKTSTGQVLNFIYEEQSYPVAFEEVDWKFYVEDAVQKAYEIGRTGSKKEITNIIRELEVTPEEITIAVDYNEEKLENFLMDTESNFNVEPTDSKMEKVDGEFVVTPDVTGVKMDLQATLHNTMETLGAGLGNNIQIIVEETPANITAEDFNFEKDLIGSFTTKYSTSQTDRVTNLVVATNYITGTIIMPDEQYSINEGMGEINYENGYRMAGAFSNGKLVEGMGGGVCQVSTTLYNAVIRAELEIVQRYAHSVPVTYVPLGMDAAVAEGYKDLIIKNDTDSPVYIEAYAKDGVVGVNLYGKEIHEDGREVTFEAILVSTTPKGDDVVKKDSTMYEDERIVTYAGTDGRNLTTYKTVTVNGKQVSREAFANTSYRSMANEVTVGTKVREVVEEVVEETIEDVVVDVPTTAVPEIDNSNNGNSSDNVVEQQEVVPEAEPVPEPEPVPVPEPTPEPEPVPESTPEPEPESNTNSDIIIPDDISDLIVGIQ